jgi:hypothetical protein
MCRPALALAERHNAPLFVQSAAAAGIVIVPYIMDDFDKVET